MLAAVLMLIASARRTLLIEEGGAWSMTTGHGAITALSEGSSRQNAFWDALVHDSGAHVMVIDIDGLVHYSNSSMAACFGTEVVVNKRLHDLIDVALADERLGLVRRVAQSGKSLTVDGRVKGVMLRCVMRLLTPAESPRKVLIVARQLAPGVPPASDTEHVVASVDDAGILKELTDREVEILRLIAEGLPTSAIAAKLGRSVKTVEWHRVSLGEKLGVSNRVELARIAIRAGLTGLGDPVAK
jgi:DNA-binding NarL/FixJ family response regulator